MNHFNLLAALSGAGMLIAIFSFSAKPAAYASIGAALGCAVFAFLVHKLKSMVFFNVEAGQLAVLGAKLNGSKLPEGIAQIAFAKSTASQRITAADFFQIDRMLADILEVMPKHYLPCLIRPIQPWLQQLSIKLAGWIARLSRKAMLVLYFKSNLDNPWRSAQKSLLLLAAEFPLSMRYQLYALFFELAGFIGFYLALLYPIDAIAADLPVDIGIWRIVFAMLFAWALKSAFLTPIGNLSTGGTVLE